MIIKSPLVGIVIRVYVNEGDRVSENDIICDIESMKTENHILSPKAGVVKKLFVKPGQIVDIDQEIAIIEDEKR